VQQREEHFAAIRGGRTVRSSGSKQSATAVDELVTAPRRSINKNPPASPLPALGKLNQPTILPRFS
jgi:hypothetical protein